MFVDVILALENKNTPQSIRFLWKILDIDKRGYLTPLNISYFFRVCFSKFNLLLIMT